MMFRGFAYWALLFTAAASLAGPAAGRDITTVQENISASVGPGLVYLAPNGDDRRSGLSPGQALRSLDRVQDLLKSGALKLVDNHLRIRFMPGEYLGMSVTWDYVTPGQQIVLEPAGSKHSAILNGQGSSGQFFLLRITTPSSGELNTGIVIRNLKITNYCEGISLGDWKSVARIAGNTIEGNAFIRIGSKYESPTQQVDGKRSPQGKCVAALRVKTASSNIIKGNTFSEIENLPSGQTALKKYGPTLLHAIYLSDRSSHNLIEDNVFDRFTGSPIRIRNESNNNRIAANLFEEPVYSSGRRPERRLTAISQWYCNRATRACLEKEEAGRAECPSIGTRIVRNRVKGALDLYADQSQSKLATCSTERLGSLGSVEPTFESNSVDR